MRGSQAMDLLAPKNLKGIGNIPKGPSVRSFREVETSLDGNHGNQCPTTKLEMEAEYKRFMEDMSKKGIEVECSQERFNDLCETKETGKIDAKSILEAKGNLQGEGYGMYKSLRRPVKLDFEAISIETGKRIFVDHKCMIELKSLAEEGKDISRFPSHATVAYNIGKDILKQKEFFIGLPQGPKSPKDVLHVVNFDMIRDPLEKPALLSAVLNGAEDKGCTEGIAFINYE